MPRGDGGTACRQRRKKRKAENSDSEEEGAIGWLHDETMGDLIKASPLTGAKGTTEDCAQHTDFGALDLTAGAKSVSNKAAKKKRRREKMKNDNTNKKKGTTSSTSSAKLRLFCNHTFAISTLDTGLAHSDPSDSYNNQKSKLTNFGAVVVDTVSKKVTFLLARKSAVMKSTQKVRKAVKRGLRIVDIDGWVDLCVETGSVVKNIPEEMDFTALAAEVAERRDAEKKKQDDAVTDLDEAEIDPNAEGWSEPIALDCCCVCHENNPVGTVTDCPWCKDCNINRHISTKKK